MITGTDKQEVYTGFNSLTSTSQFVMLHNAMEMILGWG